VKRVVIASNNPGKLREFSRLLAALDIEAVAQSALGVGEADEPHLTFVENALAKARHASRASGLAALADDSGICVPALGGAPGVHSARYAGEPKSDERNNAKLVAAVRGLERRDAFYYCALVLVRDPGDPRPIIADAAWHGEIEPSPRGSNGFGYDPYFRPAGMDCTAAELDDEHKNRVSHRGLALRALIARLKQEHPLD
jgi:XTP/dITP diphosphohydrolase